MDKLYLQVYLKTFKVDLKENNENQLRIDCSDKNKVNSNAKDTSRASLNNSSFIKDCCLLSHHDYYNVEEYHLKIIERSLRSSFELKQFRLKQSQFKLDNKKLNQLIKSLKYDLENKQIQFNTITNKSEAIKSQIRLFKRLVYHRWISNLESDNILIAPKENENESNALSHALAASNFSVQLFGNTHTTTTHSDINYSSNNILQNSFFYLNNISLIDNNNKKCNISNDVPINITTSINDSNSIYSHQVQQQQQSPIKHNLQQYTYINPSQFQQQQVCSISLKN